MLGCSFTPYVPSPNHSHTHNYPHFFPSPFPPSPPLPAVAQSQADDPACRAFRLMMCARDVLPFHINACAFPPRSLSRTAPHTARATFLLLPAQPPPPPPLRPPPLPTRPLRHPLHPSRATPSCLAARSSSMRPSLRASPCPSSRHPSRPASPRIPPSPPMPSTPRTQVRAQCERSPRPCVCR